MSLDLQQSIEALTRYFDLQDHWLGSLEALGRELASELDVGGTVEKQLRQQLDPGTSTANVVVAFRQEILDAPTDPELVAALGGRAGGAVVHTQLVLDLGGSVPVAIAGGHLEAKGRVGITIDVPAEFPDDLDLGSSLEGLKRLIEDQVRIVRLRIDTALLSVIRGREDDLETLPRGTRIGLAVDLEGQADAHADTVSASLSASTRLRATYQARADGRWRISLDRPTNLNAQGSAKIPIDTIGGLTLNGKAVLLRRRSAVFELHVDAHAEALRAALPWTRSGGRTIPRIDVEPLEKAGAGLSSSFETVVELDYGAEVSALVHPAVSVTASATRHSKRRVAVTQAGPTEVDTHAQLGLAALDLDAVARAGKGSSVLHLTQARLDLGAEVAAGRSFDVGQLLRATAKGGIAATASRESMLQLLVGWHETGRPTVELEEVDTSELALSIGASIAFEAAPGAAASLAERIEKYEKQIGAIGGEVLARLLGEDSGDDLVARTGEQADRIEKAIAEYLNASVEFGASRKRTRRQRIVAGPFDMNDTRHVAAFVALRSDHNLLPALAAGIVSVEQSTDIAETKRRFEAAIGQHIQLSNLSWSRTTRETARFGDDGAALSVDGIEVAGGEEDSFNFFGRKFDEVGIFSWSGASVVATDHRRQGTTELAEILLAFEGEITDGRVTFQEACRWLMLIEGTWGKTSLARFRQDLLNGSDNQGKGRFSFHVNRTGFERIATASPDAARRLFLQLAARIEGAPGAPPCADFDGVPITYETCRLLRADASFPSEERLARHYDTAFRMEDLREAKAMLDAWHRGSPDEKPALAAAYEARFGSPVQLDDQRLRAADAVRQLEKSLHVRGPGGRSGQREAFLDAVERYQKVTGRSADAYAPAYRPGNARAFAGAELRIIDLSEQFIEGLVDVQQMWSALEASGHTDKPGLARLFERINELAHAVVPTALSAPFQERLDRLQGYVTVHALTLIALAGSDGYEVGELEFESDLLSYRAVPQPKELSLAHLVLTAAEERGIDRTRLEALPDARA